MNEKHFNEWASNYEQTILRLQNSYPFAGYFEAIKHIKAFIKKTNANSVLDLGIGSGYMLNQIITNKMDYFGIDFSNEMLQIAKQKFNPKKLLQHNLLHSIPNALNHKLFHFTMAAYTLHHFNNAQKIDIIKKYIKLTTTNKFIVIDISFDSQNELLKTKAKEGGGWDTEEENGYLIKPVFINQLKQNNLNCTFQKISFCAGIYYISASI